MGKFYLAIDIGASSGRHIIAEIVDGKIKGVASGNATVSQEGIITGGDEGEANVTATLEFPGRDTLTTTLDPRQPFCIPLSL